jgi:hypothetical protein
MEFAALHFRDEGFDVLVEFDLLRPAGAIRVTEKIRDQVADVTEGLNTRRTFAYNVLDSNTGS